MAEPRGRAIRSLVRQIKRQIKSGVRGTTLTSSIPLILVVVMGAFLSLRSHAILRQDRDMVVHTYQVIGAVRQALLLVEEGESGQNGFVITGDPGFLYR